MLIAQISDSHIAPHEQKTYGIAPMAENLARCIQHINSLSLAPDLVLLTGDVTNDCTRTEADRAAEILSQLNCPYYLIPGNHDDRDVLWDVFGTTACPSRHGEFINYVVETDALHFIGLDSVSTQNAGGQICDIRADWLRQTLLQKPDVPTIIFMHHPPLKCGVRETDEDGFVGREKLAEIIASHSNIERILCGHIHLLTHSRWSGTIVSTAPSLGMQLDLDLTQSHPSQFVLTDPAYLLHHWTAEQNLITHAITVNSPIGPYDFRPHLG